MQRQFRLTRSTDIQRVRRSGKSYAHPFVVLIVLASELPKLRIGVTGGHRVGGAVRRNRAKRLLRSAIWPLLSNITPGWDMILIARFPLPEASMLEIRTAIISLLQRAQLFHSYYDA